MHRAIAIAIARIPLRWIRDATQPRVRASTSGTCATQEDGWMETIAGQRTSTQTGKPCGIRQRKYALAKQTHQPIGRVGAHIVSRRAKDIASAVWRIVSAQQCTRATQLRYKKNNNDKNNISHNIQAKLTQELFQTSQCRLASPTQTAASEQAQRCWRWREAQAHADEPNNESWFET